MATSGKFVFGSMVGGGVNSARQPTKKENLVGLEIAAMPVSTGCLR